MHPSYDITCIFAIFRRKFVWKFFKFFHHINKRIKNGQYPKIPPYIRKGFNEKNLVVPRFSLREDDLVYEEEDHHGNAAV